MSTNFKNGQTDLADIWVSFTQFRNLKINLRKKLTIKVLKKYIYIIINPLCSI